jgi:membrane protease YdiL (CAAX protease family)
MFCSGCGLQLAEGAPSPGTLPRVRAAAAWQRVRHAALCYLAFLGLVIVTNVLGAEGGTVELYVLGDVLLAVTVVVFAWPVRRSIVGLLRVPRMDRVAWGLLLFGPLSLWLLNTGVVSAISGLPATPVSDPILELYLAGAPTWTVLLLVCVTPPLLEEIAFRGVILEQLRDPFGSRPAVVVVSILFSVIHLAMVSFLPFAALALVLAALRLRTGSLWPAILGHAMFNGATMLFLPRMI